VGVVRLILVAMLLGGCNFRLEGVLDAPADAGGDAAAAADLATDPTDGGGPGADLAPPVFMSLALLAGASTAGYQDATGVMAKFDNPNGIAADAAGNLFVADSSNDLIRRVVVATGAVTTLAGGVGQAGRVDAVGTAARFNQPRGLAVDGNGNLYVADMGNSCIRVVKIATAGVTTLAGTGLAGSTDGIGTAAAFDSPRGVALDGLGDLYVADTQNSTVRKIVLATAQVTTIAGAAHMVGQQLGPLPGVIDQPWGIVVMPGSGALVYTDSQTADLIIIR
jgi:NHL repeat-containing protein